MKMPMETFDFDKVIKSKMQEDNDLHKEEIQATRPLVWAKIQNQQKPVKEIQWYHLAAAVALILIGSGWFYQQSQKSHRTAIDLLSNKVNDMESKFSVQENVIKSKTYLIDSLQRELAQIESQLANIQQISKMPPEQVIVYQTDTVYLKQIEYVTVLTENPDTTKTSMESTPLVAKETASQATDNDIYPSYVVSNRKPQPEPKKFKFGASFAAPNK